MDPTLSFFNRLFRSPALFFTFVMSLTLASIDPVLCKEIQDAAAKVNPETVKALLKDHPDLVSGKNEKGATALHGAAAGGDKDVAELLLANKAEVNAKDNRGGTPLRKALNCGHDEVAELLRQHGGKE